MRFDLGFYFQQVHKLSAHILLRRHRHLCCPRFASSTSFNVSGRRNLPTFENVLAQPGAELLVLTFQTEVKSTYCTMMFFQFIDFRPQ
jgi:hypothetical protein